MRKDDLKRIAGREKIPFGTVQNDYVISIILEIISKLPYSDNLIFKGGTCIKEIYFPDARFSVDLDFTCLKDVRHELLSNLESFLTGHTIGDVDFIGVTEEEKREDSVRFSVKYNDVNGHPTSVKIDLSLREKLFRTPQAKEVLNPHYADIPAFKIMALSLEEILAEKVRAAISRGAPRDIYDIWYLLGKGVPFDLELVNEKLKILKRDKTFTMELFEQCLEEKKTEWKRDLSMLVPEAPKFARVKQQILEAIHRNH